MADPIVPGAEIEVAHPFVREDFESMDSDGPFTTKTWRPGIRYEHLPPDSGEAVADGIGTQIITVVSVHKPGRFPTRVFFTRRWRAPDGHEFGKAKLCTTTSQHFRIRCRGYRHEFRLLEPETPALSSEERRG